MKTSLFCLESPVGGGDRGGDWKGDPHRSVGAAGQPPRDSLVPLPKLKPKGMAGTLAADSLLLVQVAIAAILAMPADATIHL